MSNSEAIEVELRKSKFLLLIILSCIFLAAGYWMFNLDSSIIESHKRHNNPLYIHSVGLGCIGIGLSGIVISLIMLITRSPGLVINQNGIKVVTLGEISWCEISGFKVQSVYQQKYLYIMLKNPNEYIGRCNPIYRVMLNAAKGLSPSPVAITEKLLKIEFETLVSLLNDRLKQYNERF